MRQDLNPYLAGPEYLRRNLLVASAHGAAAGARKALERARSNASTPKWIIQYLEGILERAEKLPPDLARWRDEASDRPKFCGGTGPTALDGNRLK